MLELRQLILQYTRIIKIMLTGQKNATSIQYYIALSKKVKPLF